MKCTSIDTGTIVCLSIINAVRPVPSLRVSLIGKGGQSHRCLLTRLQTADGHSTMRNRNRNQQGGGTVGEQKLTLISFIDSVSVETWGAASPVK